MKRIRLTLVLLALSSLAKAQDTIPSPEEMWAIIQAQQAEIEALKQQAQQTEQTAAVTQTEVEATRSELAETREQLEVTAVAVEEGMQSGSNELGWWERTSVGGYGELHANFFEDADNEIDFHRFVLFVNHEFNDRVRFFSELEIEHSYTTDTANGSNEGAVELEQAFVQFDLTRGTTLDAGLFLMPVGIINEVHEPTTFYGVERNQIDTRLVPSTWWEAGIRGTHRFDNGLSFDAALTSGLDVDPTTGNIRSGRQKVSKAPLNEGAVTGRVRYTGVAGLDLGASVFYQNNLAQTMPGNVSGLLSVLHADYRWKGFGIRGQYARWDLNGDMLPDTAEEQQGFYIEPSYRFNINDTFGDLGVFYRYSNYDFQSDATTFRQNQIHQAGVNYWPIDNVVFKFDVQDISQAEELASKGDWALNLGVGFVY